MKKFIALMAFMAVALTGCQSAPVEPLSVDLEGLDIQMTQSTSPFDSTAEGLLKLAEECGTAKDLEYYEDLVAKFEGAEYLEYGFKFTEGEESYGKYVLPNRVGYETLEAFKEDFDVCAAGGQYPIAVSEDWLHFAGFCGAGYYEAPDPRYTCFAVVEAIRDRIELN